MRSPSIVACASSVAVGTALVVTAQPLRRASLRALHRCLAAVRPKRRGMVSTPLRIVCYDGFAFVALTRGPYRPRERSVSMTAQTGTATHPVITPHAEE